MKNYDTDFIRKNFIFLDEIDNIKFDSRYAGEYNFVGRKILGYEYNVPLLTIEAANALRRAQHDVYKDGFSLVIYDAYRPMNAVNYFIEWSKDLLDNNMQSIFYPNITKAEIISQNYLSEKSSHSSGSTVDLTLIENGKNLTTPQLIYRELSDNRVIPFFDDNTVDMGSSFDLFDDASHTKNTFINLESQNYRKYLVEIMSKNGFSNDAAYWGDNPREWWHFTLIDEPFINEYFEFRILDSYR